MFIKIVKSANKTDYIYVVESYRDEDGSINHRYLFSLGKLKDFISTPMFKKLAQKALALDQGLDMGGVDLSCLSEGEVLKYGHFVLCFLSFLMIRTLEILLKEEGFSINKIREALNSLTVTKFSIKDETVYLKNKPEALANIIMRRLNMKPLANITSERELAL